MRSRLTRSLRVAQAVSRISLCWRLFFNLVSIALEGAASLHLMETLFPLGNANLLKVFDPRATRRAGDLSIRSHEYGFGVSLIFFGWVASSLGT